ncbi:MAG: hypothetical protein U5K30_05795 [Acidimicrobiales bacterium]|nr:hypothetical protein [Acidimicrobiales bacterium]
MEKQAPTMENPWDDPDFVALYEEDVSAEQAGTVDAGADRDEMLSRYQDDLS